MEQATLVLEAIVLPDGPVLENMAPDVKRVMSSGGCMVFYLWSCPVEWYLPSIKAALPTTPGLLLRDEV